VAEGLLVAEHHRLPLRASCLANDKLRLEESLKLMVAALKSGESVLIHCEAGQVRTGCAAGALLMMLGLSLEDALAEVRAAGSDPEPFSPSDLLRAFAVE
jgi:protein-tyrosine phosphatase